MKLMLTLAIATALCGCTSSDTAYAKRANEVLKNPPRAETETAEQKADREAAERAFGHKTSQLSVNDRLEPAVLLKHVTPEYPAEALSRKLDGQVNVDVIVSNEGRVIEAKVLSSSDPVFEAPALAAVRRWTFKPAKKNGQPIVFSAKIPIVFQP